MAASTSADIQADLLLDIGASSGDVDTDRIFERAEAKHDDADLIYAYAKTIALQQLYMQAIKLVTNRAGDVSENLSDIAKGLYKMLEEAKADYEELEDEKTTRVKLLRGRGGAGRDKSVP